MPIFTFRKKGSLSVGIYGLILGEKKEAFF